MRKISKNLSLFVLTPFFFTIVFGVVFCSPLYAQAWPIPIFAAPPENNLKVALQNQTSLIVEEDISLEISYTYRLTADELEIFMSNGEAFKVFLPDGFYVKEKKLFRKEEKVALLIGTTTKEGIYQIKIKTDVPREIVKNINVRLFTKEQINLGFNPDRVSEDFYRNPLLVGGLNLVPFPIGIGYFCIDEVFIPNDDPTNITPLRSLAIRTVPALLSYLVDAPYRIYIISAGILYDTYNCIDLANKKNKYVQEHSK